MKIYGLLGKNIDYAFSAKYFSQKFEREGITDASYRNFDLPQLEQLGEVWHTQDLAGLNVTIPYKEAIIGYLDALSTTAKAIGAVNTIQLVADKKIGHNTDAYGFEKSLIPLLNAEPTQALILGTGGAAKAVAFTLRKLGIPFEYVSRAKGGDALNYGELNAELIAAHRLIVNCTPLGSYPQSGEAPDIPYEAISTNHLVYDLVYTPPNTTLMKKAQKRGAKTKNGYEMLLLQAEKAWEIWNH